MRVRSCRCGSSTSTATCRRGKPALSACIAGCSRSAHPFPVSSHLRPLCSRFRIPKSKPTLNMQLTVLSCPASALLTPPKHDVCACVKALVAVATGFVAIIVIYGADYLTFLKFYLTGYALYGCEGGSMGAGSCVEELTAHMYEWLLWLRGQDGCIDSFIRSRFNRPHPRGVAAALSRPATQTHQSPTRWSCQRMSS